MGRHTVQNMARERSDIVIPDYTATLSQRADQLAQASKTLSTIGRKPAIELTPEDIAVQIKRASLDLLRDSSDLFRQGRKDLDLATGRPASIVGRVRIEEEQKRQTWRFAGMGLAAGMFLWSILPGTIARAMPESWHWPEWMAERALGDSSRLLVTHSSDTSEASSTSFLAILVRPSANSLALRDVLGLPPRSRVTLA